jgi:hypothetical protein
VCLALGGEAAWTAKLRLLAAMLALAGCLGAAQLVPTLRHVADSPRSETLSDQRTMTWSTRPDRFIEWVFPNLRGDPSRLDRGLFFGAARHDRGSAYLRSIYVGQLVLVLAVAALLGRGTPHRAAWTALIAVGVMLALGRHDPLYAKLLVRVPPWSLLRYPEKFLLLATTGLTFAAALGWEQMLARRDRGAAKRPLLIAAAVLILAGGLFGLPFVRPDLARDLVIADETVSADLERYRLGFLGFEALVAFSLALGSLAILALHRARRAREWQLAAGVLLLLIVDLYRAGHRFVVTARAADLFQPPPVLATLPAPSARLWTDRLFFPDSAPERFDFEAAASIPVSFIPTRDQLTPYWANLWRGAAPLKLSQRSTGEPVRRLEPRVPGRRDTRAGEEELRDRRPARERQRARRRSGSGLHRLAPVAPGRRHHLRPQVRAAVDGNRTTVLQTALGQMAIEVPPGTHHVTLRYRDPWVAGGVGLSLAGIAAALSVARLSRRDSRASAAPPPPRP